MRCTSGSSDSSSGSSSSNSSSSDSPGSNGGPNKAQDPTKTKVLNRDVTGKTITHGNIDEKTQKGASKLINKVIEK